MANESSRLDRLMQPFHKTGAGIVQYQTQYSPSKQRDCEEDEEGL